MGVVVFDPKEQRLLANCGGRFSDDESAMSLRVRRLFYVAKFAVIAVIGPSVNGAFVKDVLRALVMATAKFEKTGVYEIPLERFDRKTAFNDNDTSYVVMTKKGLYEVTHVGVRILDDSELISFGVLGSIFNVVYTKIKPIEKAISFMRRTSEFISDDNLEYHRRQCGDTLDLDSKDIFYHSFRVNKP